MSTLAILWDESYVWGLLAVRAAQKMGIPHTVLRAADIPHELATNPPAILLVPGGNARQKALQLQGKGMQAIREYVQGGGHYFGFCGGAGLALSWEGALGLCPCHRGKFDDRLQHFMSGHLHIDIPKQAQKTAKYLYPKDLFPTETSFEGTNKDETSAANTSHEGTFVSPTPSLAPVLASARPLVNPCLPVWWPGRFDAKESEQITVLARYTRPAEDFWLADLPIADLPAETFTVWRDMYGFSITPAFLYNQPCILHGAYGKGSYILSYSHLETPASNFANAWFTHLLQTLGNITPKYMMHEQWQLDNMPKNWEDDTLDVLEALLENIIKTGFKHNLLFQRTPWLFGWRTGIPGMQLNNLLLALKSLRSTLPCPKAYTLWEEKKESVVQAMGLFHAGCIQYLLAERLAQTLSRQLPEVVPDQMLIKQKEALFGRAMQHGGFYHELLQVLDTLAFLQVTSLHSFGE